MPAVIFDCANWSGGISPDNTCRLSTTPVATQFDAQYSSILGGCNNNTLRSELSTIVMGSNVSIDCTGGSTSATTFHNSVVNGDTVLVNGRYNTVVSGFNNCIVGDIEHSTILGGISTAICSSFSSIGVGINSCIETNSDYSFIGAGTRLVINDISPHTAIFGGSDNSSKGGCSVIIGGEFNSILGAEKSVIGGGYQNQIQNGASESVIAGGSSNTISNAGTTAVIAGGELNAIGSNTSSNAILGGRANSIATGVHHSAIGGGDTNCVSACFSIVGGGQNNSIKSSANWGVIGGGSSNCVSDSQFGNAIGGGDRSCVPGVTGSTNFCNFVGGGGYNFAGSGVGVLLGGQANSVYGGSDFSSLIGGRSNRFLWWAEYGFIGGGAVNQISNGSTLEPPKTHNSLFGGGQNVINSGHHSVIGGGFNNWSFCNCSAILGGADNDASTFRAGIFGDTVVAVMDDAFHTNNLVAMGMPGPGAGTGATGSLYWDFERGTCRRVFIV